MSTVPVELAVSLLKFELIPDLLVVVPESADVRSGETFAWPQTAVALTNHVNAVTAIEVVL
jgi:hypothetical protein